jgi:hypothetical protein
MVMATVELAATHGPAPSGSFVVYVSVTDPELMSPALGVYVAVGELLENVPEPLVVQVPLVAPPPSVAFNVAELLEQIVCGAPAFTVGAWFTVIVLVSVTGVHPDGASVVSVSVTVPKKFDTGV